MGEKIRENKECWNSWAINIKDVVYKFNLKRHFFNPVEKIYYLVCFSNKIFIL